MKHELQKGQPYKIKLTFKTRKTTLYFQKVRQEPGQEAAYELTTQPDGAGNHIWVTDEHIESIEAAAPKKERAKVWKTCDRCYGAGKFYHVTVQGGVCFKCWGTGKV